jgi:hypothetical protein
MDTVTYHFRDRHTGRPSAAVEGTFRSVEAALTALYRAAADWATAITQRSYHSDPVARVDRPEHLAHGLQLVRRTERTEERRGPVRFQILVTWCGDEVPLGTKRTRFGMLSGYNGQTASFDTAEEAWQTFFGAMLGLDEDMRRGYGPARVIKVPGETTTETEVTEEVVS